MTATAFTAAASTDRQLVSFLVFCPVCRRLQAPHGGCTGCGAAATSMRRFSGDLAALAPGRVSRVVRYPGDTRFVVASMLALGVLFVLAALLAGHGASSLLIVLVFAGLGAAALVDAYRAAQLATSVRRIPPSPAAALTGAAAAAHAIAGVAQPLERFVDAPLAGRECLAVRLDIRAGVHAARRRLESATGDAHAVDDSPDIVTQWLDVAEFVVTTARGARTLVTGSVYLDADEYDVVAPSDRVELDLQGHAVAPAPLVGDGWACELALGPGDRVEIYGHSTGEVHNAPVGALYRDAGALAVMRGEPGDPVIVRIRRR